VGELLPHFLVSLSAVFFVVDPIGTVPIFLSMTAHDTREKVRRTAQRACIVACGVLLFFALFGGVIFQVLGVSLGAFRVAGGILLMVTALDMLRARTSETRSTPQEVSEGVAKEDVAIVPLAIPMLAGPGAIATVMVLMSSRGQQNWRSNAAVLLAVLLTFVSSYFILRAAGLVQRVLRESGLAILKRVMGLILAAVAVQFIADGARALLWR
jgi:multiple antibiotic resistance protein